MNESIEFFEGPPSFSDLVDCVMRKYGCRVDEISLRGRFDCGKARAHYVLMKLASDVNWKHYKDVVHEANVACLEVIVEIVRMPGPNVVTREEVAVANHNGTQESEMLHHVLGEIERDFDLAIANDDFPNNIFERDEANIDVDNVSMGFEDCELEEDGVVGVEVEEESLFESGGHEYEDDGVENEEDGPQFDTATVHDVEGIRRMDDCFYYTQYELRLLKERDVKLPSIPNDKDISMVHKAICESSMVNAEGTSGRESPVIKKGMKFNSLEELKFFLADYTARLHRPFSVVHSDKNLRYNVITGQWRISNVVQPHTCRSSQPKREHVQCTTKYLGRRILGIVRKDSETSVPSLVESIFSFSGYRVKYSKAWRAKQHAVALLWGDWKESYGMVPRVLSAITYYNPRVKWCIDSCGMMHPDNGVLKHILQRVFWCFPQCSEAFQHCRPVILVDGTFLTGKYKGTLMMAVGVDPEQQLVPLALALAECENNESWSWFIKLVRLHVLGPSQIVCMISDRHHELLNCAKDHMDGFPPLVHRWCTRHFAANMSCRQKSNRVIGKLKLLCKVHTEREFNEKLEDLVKDLNDDAKEWLKGEMEDKDKWAQAFDEGGMRWGIMTTNYSESLNAVFKGIRSRPVARIIEYSFEKCNAYFVDRWQKARAMLDEGYRIGKVADDYLSEAKLRSVHHLAEPYGPERMVYSIRSYGTTNIGGESHGGRHYRVDLNEVSCTCNVPQLLHLPCSHFITACKARGLNYESPLYMSPLYSREHTIKIWESSFQPYLDPSQWPAYEGVGYVPNPNLMRNKVGRRQKKRFTGDMDMSEGRLSADYDTVIDRVLRTIGYARCLYFAWMAAPVYPLLESAYDLQHCAHHLADLNEDLKPLRDRAHSPLRWDERYAEYLQRAGFLDLAIHVVGDLPPMDGPLLTAMVDRWRPETHTFHLPFGEMTITMQDVAMILGLPLDGQPVMGIIQDENWRDMVEMHTGIRPPEPEDGDNSKKTPGPWHQDDAHPTFYHVWKHVRPVRGNPDRRYRAYTNEFDVLTQHQVEWKPYDCEQLSQIVFSPTCYRDRELWRCTMPMILYYVFGRMQPCPPLELSTSQQLHRIDRRKRYKENDWRNKQGCDPEGGPYWRPGPNNEYIRWYCTSTRTKVKPSWSNVPIEDAPSDSDADIADAYDTVTRYGTQPERAPLHDYMGQQLARLSNEAGVIMEHAVGEGDGLLRQFAERVRKSCRRMAMRMNCMSSSDVHHGGNGQGTSSGSCRTPLATPPGAATPSTAAGPSRRSRGKEPASPQASEDSEGEQSEDDDPTYGEELEISGMIDAPPVTQTQGESSQVHSQVSPNSILDFNVHSRSVIQILCFVPNYSIGTCTSYPDATPAASFLGPHRRWQRQCAAHASKEGASPKRSF
uniref:SWIM-type domain-containing protein n=1 Tax=Setaria italica TaxID=4555 RepID=K3XQ43_SETIT